ncbi:hypothetical protein L1787_00740 [Acuticoccus sp. M5D2P5]|uniref:hypothetical protein n=1 Tax=Acuticoccus kalidii TaxID=2910977 RepID=UPI001F37C57D|nr:hypothetical protein [Acuticoccus kalidii]MCF3931937.1 hypothetical protein [Acuticoccus kalidii]
MTKTPFQRVQLVTASPFGPADPARAEAIETRLYRPQSVDGRCPALVISAGGRTEAAERCARRATRTGAIALIVDTAAARRARGAFARVRVTEAMAVADAFAALVYLATRDDVDPACIHHAGLADGGTAAILTTYRQLQQRFRPDGPAFASHLAIDAPPNVRMEDYRTTGAPVALAFGAGCPADTARLDLVAGDLEQGGSSVSRHVVDAIAEDWHPAPALRVTPDGRVVDDQSGRPVKGLLGRYFALRRARRRPRPAPVEADATATLDGLIRAQLGGAAASARETPAG